MLSEQTVITDKVICKGKWTTQSRHVFVLYIKVCGFILFVSHKSPKIQDSFNFNSKENYLFPKRGLEKISSNALWLLKNICRMMYIFCILFFFIVYELILKGTRRHVSWILNESGDCLGESLLCARMQNCLATGNVIGSETSLWPALSVGRSVGRLIGRSVGLS